MSPRRPHLRNRKRIKAPRRFDDDGPDTSSPRQDSHEESEESSELEEEIYYSPEPKQPKSKARAYRGQVIEFNPNLPPAAFPTLDHPDYVHNGGHVAIDLESYLSRSQSANPSLTGSEAIDPDLLGRGCHREAIELIGDQSTMTSTTTDFSRRVSQSLMQTSITVQKQPRASIPSSIYGEPTDNGPRNPVWASNMTRMEEAGRLSDLDREIMDMESEDQGHKLINTTRKFPAWADLTVTHKLDLADAIGELFYPNAFQVMHRLRLGVPEKKEFLELLNQRQDREAREKANQQKLQEQTKDALLQGKHLSQYTFHEMVEANLYGTVDEDDHNQTCPCELEKARAYLIYCGFDPALAGEWWDVPTISSAASGTQPSLSGTAAAPPSPEYSRGYWSRRPAQLVSSLQQAPYRPKPRLDPQFDPRFGPRVDPRLYLVPPSIRGALPQHRSTQGALPQRRPTPAHALIAQHSPAAPLSKVPVQSYRVAPGNQNGNLRGGYQGAARIPQRSIQALPGKPNPSTSPDLRAINNALLTVGGTSAVLPAPQGQPSPPSNSNFQASRSLPTESGRNQTGQSNEDPYMGASSPQGSGGIVKNGDSVNKKKRKKSAI